MLVRDWQNELAKYTDDEIRKFADAMMVLKDFDHLYEEFTGLAEIRFMVGNEYTERILARVKKSKLKY